MRPLDRRAPWMPTPEQQLNQLERLEREVWSSDQFAQVLQRAADATLQFSRAIREGGRC